MSKRQLRFVHAGDLRLEQPLSGLAEVPAHLRQLFLDAALTAAQQIFDVVVGEQADLLLLSGNVVRPRLGGARVAEFLYDQFSRLAARGILVFWCDAARDELSQWPSAIPLPANVRTFCSPHVERVTVRREMGRAVVIYGCGSLSNAPHPWEDFQHHGDAYAIALSHWAGQIPIAQLHKSIHFWALGGAHQRQELSVRGTTVYRCGTHQGRFPHEEGAHGCAVVDVDQRGISHRHFVATDSVRWFHERLEVSGSLDPNGLLRMIRERTAAIRESAGGRQALVRWTIVDGEPAADTRSDMLAARLRQGTLAGDILQSLRQETGTTIPGIWSVSIDAEPPALLPSGWYEEDTVLGDYLRLVQQLQHDPDKQLSLEPISGSHRLDERMQRRLHHIDAKSRDVLLRRVAILGVDVLRGDRVLSEEVPATTRE